MSTQDPDVPYGGTTTGERLRAYALNEQTRERLSVLASRWWEPGTYLLLLLSAVVLRFFRLGERAMHHDESLHAYFGYGFTKALRQFFTGDTVTQAFSLDSPVTSEYVHVPFMHGPFQFIGGGTLMWIFGDGDYQARLLAAILGSAMVVMPWLLRKQLGTFGAIAAAALIAFSPTLTYYSRFTREDIYTAFWTLGIVIFMWRYLESQENKWLFLTAGFLAGSFCTKETTFMTALAFIGFLAFMLGTHLADKIRAKSPKEPLPYAALVAAMTVAAIPIAALWPFLEDWRKKYDIDEMPAEANLLIVMGTLSLTQYSALIQMVMGDKWQLRAQDSGNFHVHPEEDTVAYVTIFLLIIASTAVGLMWRPRTWLIAAACFWVPFVLLFSTFFSNFPDGVFSGLWGSADYWISQQDEARGNQPAYYYFITIPVYEFVPLGLSIAAMLYYGIRGNAQRAIAVGAALIAIVLCLVLPQGPDILKEPVMRVWVPFGIVLAGVFVLPMRAFDRFLIFWVVVTAFALTVASEKMPWLNVHIALALAVLGGRFAGDILERSDLREDLPKLERLAPFAYAALSAALAVLVFAIVGPFDVASFGGWALAAVAALAVYWAFSGYSRRTGIQVAMVGAIAAFTVFSLRANVLASWGHPDNPYVGGPGEIASRDYGEVPTELLVYTQTSGDIPILRDQLAQYARDTGQGYNIPIVVDSTDGFTWPWAWYLRDYKDVAYIGITPNYTPKAGAVLFVSKNDAANLNLGGRYEPGREYHHRRWFPEEGYRGGSKEYTSGRFFEDLGSWDALDTWRDFWIRRTLPASEPGTVDGIAYFPKGSGFTPDIPDRPTVVTDGTQLVIGGEGSAQGQLRNPSDVVLDAAGNIYVADTNNNRIQKYDPNGVWVAEVGGFNSPDVTLNQPWSMAVAPDGMVFVADTWNHKIVKFDKDLNKLKEWGEGAQTEPGGDPFKLFGPREIIVLTNGNVMITDTGNARLVEYTAEGEFVRQLGGKGEALGLNEPVGLVTNAAGDIYIGDYFNKRVLVLGSDLQQKQTIEVGSWGGQAVTDRAYMALLPDGRLLVTDPTGGRVFAYDASGAQIAQYDVPKGEAVAVRPVGIASDGINVFVVDASASVVRRIPLGEIIK